MPGELNNVTTTDAWKTAPAAGSVRLRIMVRNASVLYQLGYGGRLGAVDWSQGNERFLPPGGYPLDESERPFDAVRVKSATPGTPAQVTVDCVRRG